MSEFIQHIIEPESEPPSMTYCAHNCAIDQYIMSELIYHTTEPEESNPPSTMTTLILCNYCVRMVVHERLSINSHLRISASWHHLFTTERHAEWVTETWSKTCVAMV